MDFPELLSEYGYIAVFIGTFLEGESSLLAAGFFAHQRYMQLPLVVLIAFLGSFSGQLSWFLLGRYQGAKLLLRYPRLEKQSAKAVRLLDRFGVKAIFVSQYVYGFRIPASIVFGISKISFVRFFICQAISCAGWALLVATLGYTSGEAIERLLGRTEHLERYGLAAVLIGVLVFYWYTRQKEKKELGLDENGE